jgi:long-subunit acyl-CoA synthetase (AMP-forming)/acyl carrier protein
MEDLEGLFKVPVIEAYGMTEASHQIASNPLPPRKRKVGSVGVAAGPEVAIMADVARLLPAGEVGEIVIRGLSVTSGYANNPAANNKAFSKSWFRTGDQGYIDADGYLFITGRLKEMINRGGESIAPREIDDALLAHPEVMHAVAFAVPHESLGEDIAAAVVLQKGSTLTERELRQFTFSRLVDSKVPSQIIVVKEIPKGASGKLQRLGLAEKLAEQLKREFVKPSSPLELALAKIWAEVLPQQRIGIHDNFFALGGDSLKATQVIARVRDSFQLELSQRSLFEEPTIAGIKQLIQATQTLSQAASLTSMSIKDIESLLLEVERLPD